MSSSTPLPDRAAAARGSTSRRTLLRGIAGVAAASGLASLSGCQLFGATPEVTETAPPQLSEFLAATARLRDQYDAALAARVTLPSSVTTIRDNHGAHVAALAEAIAAPTPQPAPAASAVPNDRAQALAALVTLEKQARDQAAALCLATGPRFAALVGSIAAARASHLEVLS